MKKFAFTLAEVLITLTIIGVVAAIAIPTTIANTKEQEYVTGIKKAVVALDNAVNLGIANNDSPYDNEDLFKYLQKYMKVTSVYENGRHYGIANYSTGRRRIQNKTFYTKDGMRYEVMTEQFKSPLYSGILAGGKAGNCGSYGMDQNVKGSYATPCIVIVDVNGDKRPHPNSNAVNNNYWSESYPRPYSESFTDIFAVLITDDGAYPFGMLAQKAVYGSK